MLIVMSHKATKEQLDAVVKAVEAMGLRAAGDQVIAPAAEPPSQLRPFPYHATIPHDRRDRPVPRHRRTRP